jgi:phage protein D
MAQSSAERHSNIADYQLQMDGVDFTDKARPRLVSLTLTEKRGEEADDLELVLSDGDGKLAIPAEGGMIHLKLGWKQGADVTPGLVDKGTFKVDEASWNQGPPAQITVRARSADLTAGFRARKEKSYVGTTLGDIAKKVASANGLQARVASELASIPVPALEQHQRSDMALLRQLGREHDAVATVKDGNLILSPIGKGATSSGKALPAVTIKASMGSGGAYTKVDRSAGAGVEARYHDVDKGKRETVSVAGTGKGGSGKPRMLRRVYANKEDAKRAAKSEASRAGRAAASFDFNLALGRPDLYPERPATLSGFKATIDALSWVISELRHTIDSNGGLKTTVKLETRAS